jgi:cellulose synthase (UDP-forming)
MLHLVNGQPDTVGVDEPFNADSTLVSLDRPFRQYLSAATSVAALAVYAGYLVYRVLFTLNPDAIIFSVAVYFAEVHGFVALALFFHQAWHLRARRVVAPRPDLKVDVFVTTYNEDLDLLRQTLRAAVAIRYPHRTFVLDDGRRPAVRTLADEVGCLYVTRADNAHAKAGNWNNAFRQTDADFIATFDADHVPRPEYLDRTLGFFRDPKVAIVQVPQQYHNLDSVQHRVSWRARRMYGEQDAFFNLVMPGKDHWNAAFFCGTGAVLRREALEPHGGLLVDTITEDLHTSIVLHGEGWKSVYLNEVLVTGLAPADLKSFSTQRLRWAEGNLKAATISSPLRLPGLSTAQRVSYVASLFHWTVGLPKLIYYLAPPWMLFTGTFPIANFDRTFLAIYLTFLATLIGSYKIVSRGKGRLLMDELFNMVSFFTLLQAMKRVAFGRGKPGTFVVTDKKGSGNRNWTPVLPHLVLLGFSTMAMTWSLMSLGFGVTDDAFGAAVAMFWTLHNATLMLTVVVIASRPPQQRAAVRFRANFAVEARGDWATPGTLGVTWDIAEQGCALLWPEPIEVGRTVPIRLHLGAHAMDWTVQIMSDGGRQSDGWHRLGVRLVGLTPSEIDLINDAVFSLVVPNYFRSLVQPSWLVRQLSRIRLALSGAAAARAKRQVVRVPVRIQCGDRSFVTTVRDLSASGLSVQAPVALEVGETVTVALSAARRTLTCRAIVVRQAAQASREGFDTWIVGLRFLQEQPAEAIEPFTLSEAA